MSNILLIENILKIAHRNNSIHVNEALTLVSTGFRPCHHPLAHTQEYTDFAMT